MPVTISRPAGRHADDVRALRFRFRTLTFTGNYTTGGETITARSCGLFRVLGVLSLDSLVAAPAATTGGSLPKIDVASDGKTFTVRHLEQATVAAGGPINTQEKTNAEAYVANHKLDVLLIGE